MEKKNKPRLSIRAKNHIQGIILQVLTDERLNQTKYHDSEPIAIEPIIDLRSIISIRIKFLIDQFPNVEDEFVLPLYSGPSQFEHTVKNQIAVLVPSFPLTRSSQCSQRWREPPCLSASSISSIHDLFHVQGCDCDAEIKTIVLNAL